MGQKNDIDKEQKREKKSILGSFFAREERDKDYMPDLKSQWGEMNRKERGKFVLGAVFGLIVFIGALILVYLALVAIRGFFTG
jgi:hypothetical protein